MATTTGTTPLAETLASFAVKFDLKRSAARDALVEKAKMHILDGIGVGLASTTMEDHYADALLQFVRQMQSAPDCTLIGCGERAAPPLAALYNGSLIHGIEFDDRYLPRVVHTESFGVPTALALAEQRGLDGWALLEGWLIAAEVAVRLASGCNEEGLNGFGFHTTSIFGTFGAAAAASRLLGLSPERAADALSLSMSFTSGTTEGWNEGSGRNKSIQPGWAAMSGVSAAQMAEAGYKCAHTTLDGRRGLFVSHAWKNGWSADAVLEDLGSTWKCLDIAFKLYPAGGSRHNVIGATEQLVFEHDIKPDEVEHIDVEVASQYADMFERSYELSFRPSSGYNMHGSWPCNIARMILSREIGPQHLTMEAVHDPALLAIADKVTCRPGTETNYPGEERPTTVAIQTTRGTFTKVLRKSVGSANEVNMDQIVRKFRRNAGLVLPEGSVDSLVELVLDLDQLDDARRVTKLVVPE